MIAFDSVQGAQAWNASEPMKEIDTSRANATKSRSYIVEGVANESWLANGESAHGQFLRRLAAQYRVHSGGRPRICRSLVLRAARFFHPQYRSPGSRRNDVHSRLRQFVGLHRDPRGADHGPLS